MNITGLKDLFVGEKVLTIKPELAVLVGANSAIILSQIEYWLKRYRDTKSQDHYMDGCWWVYNTYQQWQDNFPWMSERTLRRAFYDLRDQGIILMREHDNFKKGNWVTINYDKLIELIEGEGYTGQNGQYNGGYAGQNDQYRY